MPAAGVRNNDVSRQAHGIACRNVIAIVRAFRGGKADGRDSRCKPSDGGGYSFLRNMPFSLVPFSGQKGYFRPDGGCRYNLRACLCK